MALKKQLVVFRSGRYIALVDIEEVFNGEIRCELAHVVEALTAHSSAVVSAQAQRTDPA